MPNNHTSSKSSPSSAVLAFDRVGRRSSRKAAEAAKASDTAVADRKQIAFVERRLARMLRVPTCVVQHIGVPQAASLAAVDRAYQRHPRRGHSALLRILIGPHILRAGRKGARALTAWTAKTSAVVQ